MDVELHRSWQGDYREEMRQAPRFARLNSQTGCFKAQYRQFRNQS
jgi:hypothetical protein